MAVVYPVLALNGVDQPASGTQPPGYFVARAAPFGYWPNGNNFTAFSRYEGTSFKITDGATCPPGALGRQEITDLGLEVQGNVVGAMKFEYLNFFIDGVNYQFRDLYLAVHDASLGQADVILFSNWKGGEFTAYNVSAPSIPARTITAIGYENGYAGDFSKPWVFQIQPNAAVSGGLAAGFDVTRLRRVYNGAPADFIDEFNYRIAKTIDTKSAALSLIKADDPALALLKGYDHYILTVGSASINGQSVDAVVVKESLEANLEKEYVNNTTLRNTTKAPLPMKTSDYQHSIAEAHSLTTTWTKKLANTIATKISIKFAADVAIERQEATYEETISWNTELTEATADMVTKTDTRVFTVPGQMVTVPAGETYKVTTAWWRARLTGVVNVLVALSGGMTGTVVGVKAGRRGIPVTVQIDVDRAVLALGLSSIKSERELSDGTFEKGSFISCSYGFSSEVGVLGSVEIDNVNVPAGVSADA
jgi:hypothetical protein